VCLVSAGAELRRQGWREPRAWRSAVAPLLSGAGIVAFAVFLWAWTGTPFATLDAQHYGWGEGVNPLALVHLGHFLYSQVSGGWSHLTPNWGPTAGITGAVVLAIGLVLLLRKPRGVSLEGMTWTLGISALGVVSQNVAPNPRILITAFPAVLVFAYRCRGRGYYALMALNIALLVVTSAVTYGTRTMTP
jgi:hypothetical protein